MKLLLFIIVIILILEYLYIKILDFEIRSIYSNFRKAIRNIENKLWEDDNNETTNR